MCIFNIFWANFDIYLFILFIHDNKIERLITKCYILEVRSESEFAILSILDALNDYIKVGR